MLKVVQWFVWLRTLVAYIGGSSEAPPAGVGVGLGAWIWGIWWGVLLIVVLTFCGQSSKFIYIDF